MKNTVYVKLLSIGVFLLVALFACQKEPPTIDLNNPSDEQASSSEGINEATKDTSVIDLSKDTSKLAKAIKAFPGLVGKEVPRVKDFVLSLNLNYNEVAEGFTCEKLKKE